MRCLVFLSLFIFSLNSFSYAINECVRSSFDVNVDRPSSLWGLVDYEMKIKKDRCIVTLKRKNLLKSAWKIDICRKPVHLKVYQYFTHKDYFKNGECTKKSKDTFCRKKIELMKFIEREGLVNAKGEREDFSSDHGRLFCLSEILGKYLHHSEIYSMTKDYTIVEAPKVEVPKVEIEIPKKEIKPLPVVKERKMEVKKFVEKVTDKKMKAESVIDEVINETKEKKDVSKKSKKLLEF